MEWYAQFIFLWEIKIVTKKVGILLITEKIYLINKNILYFIVVVNESNIQLQGNKFVHLYPAQ